MASTIKVDTITSGSGGSINITSPIGNISTGKITSAQLYNFSGTIQFGTCSQSGAWGPLYSEAVTSYSAQPFYSSWIADTDLFNVVAGVQYWRVPKSGTYTLRAAGSAAGPCNYPGLGIDISSSAYFYAGEYLKIVCGQRGEGNSALFGGGGGASFVAVNRGNIWLPILVSGGGAGMSGNSPNSLNTNRNAWNPSYRPRETQGGAGSQYGTSYSNGDLNYYWPGGGGGGWTTPGGDGKIGQLPTGQQTGGRALNSDSPLGGRYFVDTSNTYDGGFGGGGATGYNSGAAGGGGGWWGGNASFAYTSNTSDDSTYLGGGSYSLNAYTVNGTNSGAGFVYVTL